ncbi:uncharacterized protein AMSG_03909 [Thecamonas trahens ATCC 50062]|uniref:F-box domain-containing protein n=1 Tax=Thecamonas trahens ATCC 50062 TaxID=461836 RepID=A0A0L0D8Q9_THETB|nr:hypothetical protein AMSG_03909 [Thecamonas trahens ATCC 50062]KNC47678.1 hypothetical protein AMSG_03909 [Thecamonas trahens ATCC 50062]|eukprot:XP_013759162.1 hypothetical protein AMSG_03909 [Thecamonas trahens ATCC 50062]
MPPEVLHRIVVESKVLRAKDMAALSATSKHFHTVLHDPFFENKWFAMAGLTNNLEWERYRCVSWMLRQSELMAATALQTPMARLDLSEISPDDDQSVFASVCKSVSDRPGIAVVWSIAQHAVSSAKSKGADNVDAARNELLNQVLSSIDTTSPKVARDLSIATALVARKGCVSLFTILASAVGLELQTAHSIVVKCIVDSGSPAVINAALSSCLNARQDGALLCVSHLLTLDDVEYSQKVYNSAFELAMSLGHSRVARALVSSERFAPLLYKTSNVLCALAKLGADKAVAALLADGGVDPAERNCLVLRLAARTGAVGIIAILLADARIDPAVRDNEPLLSAVAHGAASVIPLFLADERVDPTARDNQAICEAVRLGHADVVELLLADSRVDPAARDNAPLRTAVASHATDLIDKLLATGKVDASLAPVVRSKSPEPALAQSILERFKATKFAFKARK